jgi:glutamate/tyrosine decarboxylase-like PLP-dependent enzyme
MRETRGLAAGSPWPCDLGPELSRGFRALKTWFTIKVYGPEKLGQIISNACALANYMKQRIESSPHLELLAPVSLNIVCFGYRGRDADRINADIVIALQESGIAVPSTTTLHGQLAIRAAIVNHRTTVSDVDALIDATLAFGEIAVNNRQPTQPQEK